MFIRRWPHAVAAVFLVLLGCTPPKDSDPEQECPAGEERCACHPNGTCNPGLDCASGFCVVMPDAGQTAGSSTSGAANSSTVSHGTSGSVSTGQTSSSVRSSSHQPPSSVAASSGPNSSSHSGSTDLVLYDGEAHPFFQASTWDENGSTVVDSTASPHSGTNHLRCTIHVSAWWGAAAYVFGDTPVDASRFESFAFQAKANAATNVAVYLLRAGYQQSTASVSVALTTGYQRIEIPVSSFAAAEARDVIGFIYALSVDGNPTFTIDMDDIILRGTGVIPGSSSSASSSTVTSSSRSSSSGTSSSRSSSSSGTTGQGEVSGMFRVNNFGWRPADRKVAVLLGQAGASVQLRSAGDDSVVGTYTASAEATDPDSGDRFTTVDFSAFTTPGDYYLYLPTLNVRSYTFGIRENVYRVVGAVAMKSFYFQRCNHDRVLPYASDSVADHVGAGGEWVDGACHATDSAAPAGPGSADHGPLDVHGGWHDAGDYQKTLWGRGVPEMLFAYEINPGVWSDGQLNIPESGNGIPDILDEVRWELDFYVRMQRPDGHFMSSTKGRIPDGVNGISSPPSASNEGRVYFDGTSPSGNGWSGGGVTLDHATGQAVLSLAHAAIVFRAAGQTALADGYAAAARRGWTWLNGRTLTGNDARLRAVAAAAVHRMDSSVTSAGDVVAAFPWSTWDGMIPNWSATPGENTVSIGAWHTLLNAAASSTLKNTIRTAVVDALVDRAFSEEGAYGGLFGGPGNGWDYSWGSNRTHGSYGSNLMMARHLGVLGSHTSNEVATLAQKYFHYLLGLNPLNMVYLTNMAAYGGEHSSFQLYHGWFSYTGGDGDHGNAEFNGKPTWVDEPLYPYHPADTQTSLHGPAPGLLVGGPNFYYSGSYQIPNRTYPPYAYRDFSVSCDWDGNACRASSWEITEPMAAYQGPFILLVSFMMSGNQ